MSDYPKLLTMSAGDDIAEKWKQQYFKGGKWKTTISGNSESTYRGILEAKDDLGKIDAAIGNDSWTHFRCGSCGGYVRQIVQMLEDDYETTPFFCRDCIEKAAALL